MTPLKSLSGQKGKSDRFTEELQGRNVMKENSLLKRLDTYYVFRCCLFLLLFGFWSVLLVSKSMAGLDQVPTVSNSELVRAKVFVQAGDYRRAVEACQRHIDLHPSVEAYVYLAYVYQAIDGYLAFLAKQDVNNLILRHQWRTDLIEHAQMNCGCNNQRGEKLNLIPGGLGYRKNGSGNTGLIMPDQEFLGTDGGLLSSDDSPKKSRGELTAHRRQF
jgi:hypothetical protein